MELTQEARDWQLKARTFAQEHIRPISLERDRIEGAAREEAADRERLGDVIDFEERGHWAGTAALGT